MRSGSFFGPTVEKSRHLITCCSIHFFHFFPVITIDSLSLKEIVFFNGINLDHRFFKILFLHFLISFNLDQDDLLTMI